MAAGKINLQKASGGITAITSVDGASNTNLVLPESGTVSSVDTSVTDNAIARYNGTTGKLQNSGVIIDDNGYVVINQSISLPSAVGSKITAFSKYTPVGGNASFLRFDTVRTSAGSTHESSEERIRKVIDATEMGYIGFGVDNVKFGTGSGDKVIIDSSGNVLLTSGTGGLGYGAGAGGTVTQLTSKSTAVTLNKPTGQITMNNAALAAGASVAFTLNNSLVTPSDTYTVNIVSGGTFTNYRVENSGCGNGGIIIRVTNISAGSLSEAIVLQFTVIKGANS